jgi:hypothetical protein
MSHGFGLMIESLVAVLLLLTIGYCVILNRRLKRLKADEYSLKVTISELLTATEIAERAVAGLKITAHECEGTLGERLQAAERCCAELGRHVRAGEVVLDRISRVVMGARPLLDATPPAAVVPPPAPAPPPSPDLKSVVAAAHAFMDRARERKGALAA